jgi:predicted transcriptional regulator of viral defense system
MKRDSRDTKDAGFVPYTTMSNTALYDSRLKPSDFRLLFYVASKPDGWLVITDVAAKELGMNRETVRISLNRLEDAFYVKRIFRLNELGHRLPEQQIWHESPYRSAEPGEIPPSHRRKHSRGEIS